jgi:hypothetical protein
VKGQNLAEHERLVREHDIKCAHTLKNAGRADPAPLEACADEKVAEIE